MTHRFDRTVDTYNPAMTRSNDTPAVVTARDRQRMRRLGAWKAGLPALTGAPPRSLKEVFEINEDLRRMAGQVARDDPSAVEQHVRFRTNLLRLHSESPSPAAAR